MDLNAQVTTTAQKMTADETVTADLMTVQKMTSVGMRIAELETGYRAESIHFLPCSDDAFLCVQRPTLPH